MTLIILQIKPMAFSKINLKYNDYKWSAYPSDDPKITGKPDSTLFNRHEGYEMLYLIQTLMETWGLKEISSGQKIEKMVKDNLPSTTRSQSGVKDWIYDNWKKYNY